MPDARSGNDNGRTQGGSNANVVVADAYVKGLKVIDYKTAFAAMVHDAEVPPADPQKEGRGGLKDYNKKGYVTLADERSGSRTAEYSYDDLAISEVPCGLGKDKGSRALCRPLVGIYGVLSLSVAVRPRELAIRCTVGAT
jgi:putative alpha-1,2-mannosidase